MEITILGPGNMGTALATVLSKKGHEITFSHSKNEEKINQLLKLIQGSKYEKIPDAVSYSDVIIITTGFEGLAEIFEHRKTFKDKIVISCTSNLNPNFSGNTIGLATKQTISVAEEIQQNLSEALVAEAFNTAFALNIGNPNRLTNPEMASIFYCSDHESIKPTVAQLITDLQYEPVDAGMLKSARALETLATVWVQMTVVANKYPGFGLKIVQQ